MYHISIEMSDTDYEVVVRHLQSVANYLILRLAVTDLLVAILVMLLGAVYEVFSFRIQKIICGDLFKSAKNES